MYQMIFKHSNCPSSSPPHSTFHTYMYRLTVRIVSHIQRCELWHYQFVLLSCSVRHTKIVVFPFSFIYSSSAASYMWHTITITTTQQQHTNPTPIRQLPRSIMITLTIFFSLHQSVPYMDTNNCHRLWVAIILMTVHTKRKKLFGCTT